ncbi:hypothetical protein ANN_14228 [Periplaneta americana]|uniref:Reverse transcriptase domain-containing protein n=1 Tax=Periplaneta americana TaxID=6978 RepID=A0ABQ8SWT5_PERAM|nr:hypothetical protein ANN_14228 [Periplaneta americana]
MRLVKCFVWSVALYGGETWTLRRREQTRLETFEMWIWRRTEHVKSSNKFFYNFLSSSYNILRMLSKQYVTIGIWKIQVAQILFLGQYNFLKSSYDILKSAVKKLKVRIYKTVILPVVLHGCETWTLTFREEQRLRVFENKILRKIFGANRDEVTGEWRKLHNAELHIWYSSPDIIRNIKSRRVPQGSILAPFLYLIYTHDIPTAKSDSLTVAQFADDIAVLSKGDTGEQVTTILQNFLQEIEIWNKKWRTVMNTNKSSTVTFTYLKKEKVFPLYLNCSPVPQHEEVRHLGLILDSRLTWNKHLTYTLQKLRYRLHRLKAILSSSSLSLSNKSASNVLSMFPTNCALCAASPTWTASVDKQEMSAATEWLNVHPAALTLISLNSLAYRFQCNHQLRMDIYAVFHQCAVDEETHRLEGADKVEQTLCGKDDFCFEAAVGTCGELFFRFRENMVDIIPIKCKAKPGSNRVFMNEDDLNRAFEAVKYGNSVRQTFITFHIPIKALERRVETGNSTNCAIGSSDT